MSIIIERMRDQSTIRRCDMVIPHSKIIHKKNKHHASGVDDDAYIQTSTVLCSNNATHVCFNRDLKGDKDPSSKFFRCDDHIPGRKVAPGPVINDATFGEIPMPNIYPIK